MTREIAVVILAGGEGRRIGGAKPLRRVGETRLIDLAVEKARLWSDKIAVAVRDPAQVAAIDAQIIEDDAIEGPMGGLSAGLKFARGEGCSFLLTVPADMPFLPENLLQQLMKAIGPNACALAVSGGYAHPVCALWRVDALARLDAYFATGRRSLRGFAEAVGHVTVDWPGGPEDPFFNINSMDDLAEAERRLR